MTLGMRWLDAFDWVGDAATGPGVLRCGCAAMVVRWMLSSESLQLRSQERAW